MTNQTIVVLIITFALLWGLQMFGGGWQARRFMRAVRQIRMSGRTAIGSGGKRWPGKAFVALAVDASDRVVAATHLTGKTVLAAPRPVPGVVGHHLHDLLEPTQGPLGDTAVGQAAADAAEHLLTAPSAIRAIEP